MSLIWFISPLLCFGNVSPLLALPLSVLVTWAPFLLTVTIRMAPQAPMLMQTCFETTGIAWYQHLSSDAHPKKLVQLILPRASEDLGVSRRQIRRKKYCAKFSTRQPELLLQPSAVTLNFWKLAVCTDLKYYFTSTRRENSTYGNFCLLAIHWRYLSSPKAPFQLQLKICRLFCFKLMPWNTISANNLEAFSNLFLWHGQWSILMRSSTLAITKQICY